MGILSKIASASTSPKGPVGTGTKKANTGVSWHNPKNLMFNNVLI